MNYSVILLVSFAFFGLFIAFMAIGAIVQGKCLKGTCGGLNQMRDESGAPICEACAPDKVKQLYPEN